MSNDGSTCQAVYDPKDAAISLPIDYKVSNAGPDAQIIPLCTPMLMIANTASAVEIDRRFKRRRPCVQWLRSRVNF
jgi:hypothetical protein